MFVGDLSFSLSLWQLIQHHIRRLLHGKLKCLTSSVSYTNLLFEPITNRAATLLKKRLWYRCFPLVQVNFAKFLRTPFLQHTWRQLLKPALFEVDICFISTSN